MNERTKEIEAEMDKVSKTGDVGRMMDLVDEHGNTFDKMHDAIAEGDLDRIAELEHLGLNITNEQFWKSAIISDQLLVVVHQVHRGVNINKIINFAKPRTEPFKMGRIVFFGNHLIWQWAKSWKAVNALSKKLPPKGQPDKKTKI
jgi:hypothetical protein